jgi:Na+-translocating ferredoxin:NAD+ oxidoreductase RNF subunit RnfB
VREERILEAVDDWLDQLADSKHRDATIASVLAAICAGMDASLAAATTKQIQLDLAAAESTVATWEHQHTAVRSLTADDVNAALITPVIWPRS